MAEKVTGISLKDIKTARQDVVEQQRAHALLSTNPRQHIMLESSRYQAELTGKAEQLRVRNMVLTELGRQGTHLPSESNSPVFHPDVLSSDFDPEIARGEVMPVMVPFGKTTSGLEVPLYTIDATRNTISSPLGELVEEADPEHSTEEQVMKIVKGEGPRVVEKLGLDPEITSIQVVKAPELLAIFKADATPLRRIVTATPSSHDEMVTVKGTELGSHPANKNSVPTQLVIARRIPMAA